MAACTPGTHDLAEVYRRRGTDGIDQVVRWCRQCGAIVIDTDVDGRTQPGDIMPMVLPRNALKD